MQYFLQNGRPRAPPTKLLRGPTTTGPASMTWKQLHTPFGRFEGLSGWVAGATAWQPIARKYHAGP